MKALRAFHGLAVAALAAFAQHVRAAPPAEPAGSIHATIHWRAGDQSIVAQSAETKRASVAALDAGAASRHVVICFAAAPSAEQIAALAKSGVALTGHLEAHAWVAAITAGDPATRALADDPGVLRVDPLARERKIDPELATALQAGAPPSWTIVAPARDPLIAVIATFQADVALDQAAAISTSHRATVRSSVRTLNALVLELPASEVAKLADDDAVLWLESPLPRLSSLNLENRAETGTNVAQSAPLALDGAGVNLFIFDVGLPSPAHPDLADRLTLLDGSAFVGHTTHVAGTAAGTGAASFGVQRGMAPGAHMLCAGFAFDPAQGVIFYDNPGDLEADFAAAVAHAQYPGDIASSSLGSNVADNFMPCSIQGNYGATDRLLDGITRGTLGRGLATVFAGGNERQSSRCNGEGFGAYYSIAPPAGSKNPLIIGAINADDDSMAPFSSWGPTDDGRLKPDFVAPGCQTSGDGGITSCALYGGYETRCGTSMSAPTVAGIAALLLEEHRRLFPGRPTPANATYKALLAHTALDHGNTGPDYQFGYGAVRAPSTLTLLGERRFATDTVSAGQAWTTKAVVGPGEPQLKLTLAWDDPPAAPNIAPQLVNDLDLVVTGPEGTRFYPWTLDPLNPSAPAARTQVDRRNNIEQVVVDAPPPGEYTVTIAPFLVPQGPQSFSLASSAALARCTARGALWIDAGPLSCDGTLQIEVADCDLNTSSTSIESAPVRATSTTDPIGFLVTLTEIAPNAGVFRGSVECAPTALANKLHVTHADTVRVTYTDTDDGDGGSDVPVAADAAIDCLPPVISNVRLDTVSSTGAAIAFDTSEPAFAAIALGVVCGAPTLTATAPGRHTANRVFVPSLPPDTAFRFTTTAVDAAGNVGALAAPGGGCFQFRTNAAVDYFTEIFQADDNDLNSKSVLFTPNGSNNYYQACRTAIGALPTNPAGGFTLALADDGSAMISPAGGPLLLYGVAYDAVWINANGTLTFEGPDADFRESTFTHFSRPAIAVLWDNLNPAAEGVVSWKETADRVAITWENVIDAGLGSNSTFQAELFFDGSIRLSWLEAGILDGLTGLSQGGGRQNDFADSNITGYALCGPRPPGASDLRRTIPTRTAITLELPAGDDAANPLSYVILTVPNGELRDAANQQRITAANIPYTLAPGTNRVIYFAATPIATDSFQFRATDGGTPPSGGDSNVGTVTLTSQTPLTPPIVEHFGLTDFDAGLWEAAYGATADGQALAPPSPPYAARLNGDPHGGDALTTRMIDLRGYVAAAVSYRYERRGGGDSPESGDDLIVRYLAADGRWHELARHTGSGPDMTSFVANLVALPPDGLHRGLRLRFESNANEIGVLDDWFVDDLEITGVPLPAVAGDVDCSGTLTNFDVDPFVLALVDPMGYAIAFPNCDARRADLDGDGELTNFDVDPFVTCLINFGCP